jgi:hypothetical protein
MTEREDDDEEESQVVRKGDDAKAHKELNKLGGDMDGEKEVDTGKAQDALTKLAASGQKSSHPPNFHCQLQLRYALLNCYV